MPSVSHSVTRPNRTLPGVVELTQLRNRRRWSLDPRGERHRHRKREQHRERTASGRTPRRSQSGVAAAAAGCTSPTTITIDPISHERDRHQREQRAAAWPNHVSPATSTSSDNASGNRPAQPGT